MKDIFSMKNKPIKAATVKKTAKTIKKKVPAPKKSLMSPKRKSEKKKTAIKASSTTHRIKSSKAESFLKLILEATLHL
jgi:hypothetical protein